MSIPRLDTKRARKALQEFRFADLFIEELGWDNPVSRSGVLLTGADKQTWKAREVCQLGGFRVFEITAQTAGSVGIPNAKDQQLLWKQLSAQAVENIAIFVDAKR